MVTTMSQASPDVDENAESQGQAPATPSGSSLFGKLKVLFFVVLVIGIECSAAYWFLPSAAETALLAGATEETKKDNKSKDGKEVEKDQNAEAEVNLGEFNVTAYQPVSNTTLRIDFHLYGTIAVADQKEFGTSMEENLHRFRDQVIITVRSAEIGDLTDAGLSLIKRKILEKTNRMLGKPLLQSVIFSDFSFIEQ
jgi:hypothetical protein